MSMSRKVIRFRLSLYSRQGGRLILAVAAREAAVPPTLCHSMDLLTAAAVVPVMAMDVDPEEGVALSLVASEVLMRTCRKFTSSMDVSDGVVAAHTVDGRSNREGNDAR